MHEAAVALPRAAVNDRVVGALYILVGWTIVYLVMFDHGFLLDFVLGSKSNGMLFHELFHDGRHFGLVPCH
jgi:hypothetical protein